MPALALAVVLAGCGSDSGQSLEPLVAKGNGDQILAAVQSPEAVKATAAPTDPFAAQALRAINEARAAGQVCGGEALPPAPAVLWNDRIAHAALLESQWMQTANEFSHAWPDGTRVGRRLDMAQYDWYMADENIAAGFGTLEGAMQAWIDSPSHCRALMRADLTEGGMAVVPGDAANTYVAYWTMVLARPPV
ncbi:MAG: CAP domain-containing protein [Burkholderiaceae bacterium]